MAKAANLIRKVVCGRNDISVAAFCLLERADKIDSSAMEHLRWHFDQMQLRFLRVGVGICAGTAVNMHSSAIIEQNNG